MLKKVLVSAVCMLFIVGMSVIYITEGAVHLPRQDLSKHDTEEARILAQAFQRNLIEADISKDDARLRGWYFTKTGNNPVIILLHGQGDNRAGMLSYTKMFLRNGYDVLAPDFRAHGKSEGTLSTYGIKETGDLSGWIDWLKLQNPNAAVFGLGESMGAAILLQSLQEESRWSGIVAESSFSDFHLIAKERLCGNITFLCQPFVGTAIMYARIRYGLNFDEVSPAKAISKSKVPVLLIHGVNDTNIRYRHSELIAHQNPHAKLWSVPNCGHTAAFGTHPEEFERRVLAFLKKIDIKNAGASTRSGVL